MDLTAQNAAPPHRRVLFVDDEPAVVESLLRAMYPYRKRWAVETATSAAQALEKLSHQGFDVVVTDARMPEMDGEALLKEVVVRWPTLVRVMLTGDMGETVRHALAHHVVAKPVAAAALFHRVEQSLQARDLLTDPALQALVGRLGPLPSMPTTFSAINRLSRQPDATLDQLVCVVEEDLAVCSNVLRVVNSAWFGLRQPVSSMREAVRLLGIRPLENVVLATEVFSAPSPGVERLRRRALARLASGPALVDALGVPALRDAACTALVLVDVGELVLHLNLPAEALRIDEAVLQGRTREDVERERLGADHALLGAVLLSLWGIPTQLIEAVAFHHQPAPAPAPASLRSLVALACALQEAAEAAPALRPGAVQKVAPHAHAFGAVDLEALLGLSRASAA